MALALKDQNKAALYAVIAANLVVYFTTAKSGEFLIGDWQSVSQSWYEIIPVGLGLVVVGVLNAQVDATAKARLVFGRWSHPLPGCEAFSRWGKHDARVNMHALEQRHGPLPSTPAAQNSLWFKMYKGIENEPAVLHAHREYLFTRDYHFLSALMLVGLGVTAALTFASTRTILIYLGALLLQFLMTGQAARNHGRQLVCTVLARAAAA